MKKSVKLIGILLAFVLLLTATVFAFSGCGSEETAEKEDANIPKLEADTSEAPSTLEQISYPAPLFAHGSAFDFVEKAQGYKPQYVNPYTGLESKTDLSSVRAVAIMINNIEQAMPQIGVSDADILYECLAEGGITRLLMVTRDYESLGTVGSIRSSREYYIDLAKNHDAIYVHAGGSEEAYSQIYSRSIEHLDGVRADQKTGKNVSGTVFYRDSERLKTMAYEHTLVTTGERIADGIAQMGYRTAENPDFSEPFVPVDWGWSVELSGNQAKHIKVPYRSNRVSEYEYDAKTGRYMRYQFTHKEHIDGATGEQLGFENVIILRMPHENTGDYAGHIVVNTVGSGEGWFATGGKVIPVKWSKASQDSGMKLTDAEGYPIIINHGKTVINIVDNQVFSSLTFN